MMQSESIRIYLMPKAQDTSMASRNVFVRETQSIDRQCLSRFTDFVVKMRVVPQHCERAMYSVPDPYGCAESFAGSYSKGASWGTRLPMYKRRVGT
jgi:hypothetical protein